MRGIRWIAIVLFGSAVAPQVAWGQADAAAAPTAATAAPAAAPASGGFLKNLCAMCAECKAKLCASPAGQLLNGMTAPATALTGGVIPSCCPNTPTAADLASPGATGAAAQAKKDAAEAKARREAVRYLGTLDCRYNPEAEVALIAALRADRIECVRFEAALAFMNGCCCNRRVMEALEICVSGSEKDGNPGERSCRVRDAAYHALHRCLACYVEPAVVAEVVEQKGGGGLEISPVPPKEIPPKEIAPTKPGQLPPENLPPPIKGNSSGQATPKTSADAASSNAEKRNVPVDRALIERVQRTMATYSAARRQTASATASAEKTDFKRGSRDVFHAIKFAIDGSVEESSPDKQISVASRSPMEKTMVMALPPAPTIQSPIFAPPTPVSPMVNNPPKAATLDIPSSTLAYNSMTPPPPIIASPSMVGTKPTAAPGVLPLTEPAKVSGTPDFSVTVRNPPLSETVHSTSLKPEITTQPISMDAGGDHAKVEILVKVLTQGDQVEKRHLAAVALSEIDYHKNPQVLSGLIKAAQTDIDRRVRVSCIRLLSGLKATESTSCLTALCQDKDSWVRTEAEKAVKSMADAKN